MKKRVIGLFVENKIGVLAQIASLFSSKSYNMDSLTVGVTEDQTISRMTISLTSNDQIFEQIKKQLNRMIDVIKVVDYSDIAIQMKELMFIKINNCSNKDITEITQISKIMNLKIIDYAPDTLLLESLQTENRNNELVVLLEKNHSQRLEIVRGGNVAIEALSITER